jgi:branched-chain amino acid transport system substrate-binding protein
MLSGKAPFTGTTPHAVLYKQINEPPPSIQQTRPDLPAGVAAVFHRALAKERDKRYPTTKSFVSALRQALTAETVAPPAKAPTRVTRKEQAPAEAATQVSTREQAPAAQPSPAGPRPTPPSTPAPTPKPELAAKPARARRGVPRLAWVLAGLAALVLVAMGVLIALSGTDTSTPTPTTQPPVASQPTLPPAPQPTSGPAPTWTPLPPPPECPDPLGCVEVRKGEPIRIGYILVLSGPDNALGIDAQRGVEIAADERREILGHSIELVGQDSKCNAAGGEAAAAKMAPDPQVVGIIGTSCSSEARAAAPLICAANKPMISPSNTAPELTDPGRPPTLRCYLRTAPNDRWQGEVMARFAWEAGFRRAATCHDGTIYSQQLMEVFVEQFRKLGGEITAQETVGPDDTDVRPMLSRVVASGAQFFYFPVFFNSGSLIPVQAKEVQGMEKVKLAGAEAMFTIDFLKATGVAAVGLVLTSPDTAAYGDRYQEFRKRYTDRFGEPPIGPYHAHAYDAAMMMFDAIAGVGKLDDAGTLFVGRQALLDALFATKGLPGITGNLTCNPFGDCADPKIAVYEIVNADTGTWNPGPEGNPRRIWP